MKVLLFARHNDYDCIENAIDFINKGDDVTLVQCDGSLCFCERNVHANSMCCKLCKTFNCYEIRKHLKKHSYTHLYLKDLIFRVDKDQTKTIELEFNSIKELKNIVYKSVEIGYGAFSSYVSLTRNVSPEITSEFKKYIIYILKKEILLVDAFQQYIISKKPDLIFFHNGRFAQMKPLLGLAQKYGIAYIAGEHIARGGVIYKNYFYNDVPHSISENLVKMEQYWNMLNPNEREKQGLSFFEKRRHGIVAGDKVYIKRQKKGNLPKCWNGNVENIVIFNSSEDEFCSISKNYDSYNLFSTQFEGMEKIFDHYKNDKSKHFYLRIHPNLGNIPYKAHMDLYKFKYDNVTIIPPLSDISSYSLMDASSKVIVFCSTMGLESAFWGKTVISLTKFYATELAVAYRPCDEEELWNMIDSRHLPCLKNENLEKIGCYFLRLGEPYHHLKVRLYDGNF